MSRVSVMDQIRLGPTAASVKAQVGPKRWARIVRIAHNRGLQIDSFLDPNTPNALKARTPQSLRAQATKTITTAYKPAETALNQQDARIKAISDKRALDNQYYSDWLRTRTAELQAHQEAANQTLQTNLAGIAQVGNAAAQSARQDVINASQAHAGTVSDFSQAQNAPLQTLPQRDAGLLGAQQVAGAEFQRSASTLNDYANASNFAQMAASEAKRVGDMWDALQGVANDRQKLQLQKGADIAKEISRLLDGEVSKAQQAQQLQSANAALNIKQKQLNLDTFRVHHAANVAQGNLTLGQNRLQFDKDQAAIANSIKQAATRINQGKLNLGWYKAKHPNVKPGNGAKSQNPQERFDYGYALVASSVYSVYNKKTKGYDNKPFNPKYVARHQNTIVAQLVSKGLPRREAKAIVRAYGVKGGEDPGSFQLWLRTPGSGAHPAQGN